MPVLNPGTTFANGEQLTASDLNLLVQGATFTQSSVDNQSTQLVGTAIVVADSGIIAAKLAADAVTTSKIKDAEVTFAKLTDVIDDNTMDTATDTTLATSESIKAYVDAPIVIEPTNLTLLNSAVPYDAGFETPSYYKTKGNFVTLRGLFKGGIANPFATLPVGFRPAKQLIFAVSADYTGLTYGVGRVDVKPDGDLFYYSANNNYNGLDGVTFLADGT